MLHAALVNLFTEFKIQTLSRRIILAILWLSAACTVSAQYRLRGSVLDAMTRESLAGVRVYAIGSAGGTTTQANGNFQIQLAGPVDTVQLSCPGYDSRKLVLNAAEYVTLYLSSNSASLNEVVVSASREAEKRSDAPVAISVISARQLDQIKPVSLDQVLNQVSGVYMVDLGNEQHTMAIRQPIAYGSTFLYLEDGIPIRTVGDFNHNALIEINEASAKDIEIIKGPSSSLYGSDAIGGTVNFITQTPSVVPTASLQLQGSDWGYRRADFSASGTTGQTGLYIGGYYADQQGGYLQYSDFYKLALTARIDESLGAASSLTFEADLVDYRTDQTGGLDSAQFYGKDYRSDYTFTYRKVNTFRFRTTWNHDWGNSDNTFVTLYLRQDAIGQNPFYDISNSATDPLQANGQINVDAFKSIGLIAQHTRHFRWKQARLIAGINLDISPATYTAQYIAINRDTAGYYTSYQNTDSMLTDYQAGIFSSAAYLQFDMSVADSLKLVAGLRYDRLDYIFNNYLPPSAYSGSPSGTSSFKQLTPKLGLTYDFGHHRGAYLNYSKGFAPPEITDLYSGVKTPYLQPAEYTNYEAGGWWSFPDNRGYVDLSAYRMNGRDEIISVQQADGSYLDENTGSTSHTGLEYTVQYAPVSVLTLRFSGTSVQHIFVNYVEEGKNYSGLQMNGAPHFIANGEATLDLPFLKGFQVSGECEHVSKYFMDPGNTQIYKGYNLFNARLRYTRGSWEVFSNLINVANTVYATSAEKTDYAVNYYLGRLRTLYFGIKYSFTKQTKYH